MAAYSYLPNPASADDPRSPIRKWWSQLQDGSIQPSLAKRIQSLRSVLYLKFVLGGISALVVLHFVILGAFPASTYASFHNGELQRQNVIYDTTVNEVHQILDRLDPAAGQPGTFFRDSYPIRSMIAFWELAEKEVEARKLDTCGDQLGRRFIDAYHDSAMPYCLPPHSSADINLGHSNTSFPYPETRIWCAPVHRNVFSKWWPYPSAPCVSSYLRPVAHELRDFKATGCDVTGDGDTLLKEMGREKFLGSYVSKGGIANEQCQSYVNRTSLIIGRQDQWNPFHVAEDLITTLVTVFIAARMAPSLINSRVQLVFAEGFGLDQNHFTPLWDRVGAWAPRRLGLDPWEDGVCLTEAIHSVGAGASLLSAMGVGSSYKCASTITWAASHYYRHLFGLLPISLLHEGRLNPSRSRRPINILWLSRAKLDAYAEDHDDWSTWRGMRHLNNEEQLLARLRGGLSDLCSASDCIFEDAREIPESWSKLSPTPDDEPLPIRFASIDPTVHALENQIQFVGHSSILISSHGGALGLSLFLPPGDGAIIELQVGGVSGNYHFQHMAYEMGHQYVLLEIKQTVNVEQVWDALEKQVMTLTQRM